MASAEQLLIEEYANPDIRDRLLFFAADPKRRRKLVKAIHTSHALNPAVLRELNENNVSAEAVYRQMRGLGAEDSCFALSALETLDGKELPLRVALGQCVGFTIETVLICTKSKIGYFEGGHPNDRYVLFHAG